MLRNLFLTALRNFRKNKFFSVLNILGLGIGMAVFLLIAQYVKFERSYEDFIPGRDNIYRVKVVALAIAMLTVSYQTIKAAMANPVKSLRTE